MSKSRPATSGYARIAQAEEEDEDAIADSEEEESYGGHTTLSTSYAPIQPERHAPMQSSGTTTPTRRRALSGPRHRRSSSGVDIKAINARLERWGNELASKFKIRRVRGKTEEEEELEIHHSVFQAPDWIRPATAEALATDYADPPGIRLSEDEFEEAVESVRVAIEMGVHPKLITQGSSGSYFARNADGKIVGVFKPKDEEPYASRNPKWTKWIHRNLFPFFFGRDLLIPNLSYVSEAAAYVLDMQLRTNIVPYTDIVSLSSKSFYYDFWDRRAYYRKKKPLPDKIGSFQMFLKGYKDATRFLKEHPWPDQHNSGFRTDAAPKRKRRRWADDCRPGGAPSDDEDDSNGFRPVSAQEARSRRGFWTHALQQSFREELEKLVILDYIMRNTDRGLDNWMIRIDHETEEASIVVEPAKANGLVNGRASPPDGGDPYKRQEAMTTAPSRSDHDAQVRLGAIDNSLSWPWKHPDAWRSYPFGWLFLPVSLIGQPFSARTRQHFLPLLTSPGWWSDTQLALRRCFARDADFQDKMFARQMAVMKGQAWNVVETLKCADHGPLELCRRTRCYVWDDLVDVPVAVPLRGRPRGEEQAAAVAAAGRKRAGHERGGGRRKAQDEREREREQDEEMDEEMDISSAREEVMQRVQQDLLGLDSPPGAELRERSPAPPNRFNVSRQSSSLDTLDGSGDDAGPLSPAAWSAAAPPPHSRKEVAAAAAAAAGQRPRAKGGPSSHEDPRRVRDSPESRRRRRRRSAGARRGSYGFPVEDDEGDLGYAAAEDMEGLQKKVIVERLETVKSRNPVFTWC